ncbi:hypothetical protein J1605_011843 [Eschrichtius robustus]|uniref:Uncharacterized protein n=1 Tax=Eschrichtius robustus TaxID=9764 RepID=A0AB34GP71_ESCRO|nr:hypothetical protein J1605_011843 [Eschrichtius robustus]
MTEGIGFGRSAQLTCSAGAECEDVKFTGGAGYDPQPLAAPRESEQGVTQAAGKGPEKGCARERSIPSCHHEGAQPARWKRSSASARSFQIRASGRSLQSPESLLQSRDGLVSSPRGNPALQKFLCTRGFPTPPSLSLQSWFPLIDIQRPGYVKLRMSLAWPLEDPGLPSAPGQHMEHRKGWAARTLCADPQGQGSERGTQSNDSQGLIGCCHWPAGSVLRRQFPPKPHEEGTWRKQPKGGPAELPALVSTLHAVPVGDPACSLSPAH